VKTLKETTGEGNSTGSGDSRGESSADIELNSRHIAAYSVTGVGSTYKHSPPHTYHLPGVAQRICATITSFTTSTSSASSNKTNNAGAVFGLSASADRAARVISPLLGGVLIHHFHTAGLVFLATCSVSYGLYLLSGKGGEGMNINKDDTRMQSVYSIVYSGGRSIANSAMYSIAGILRVVRSKLRNEIGTLADKQEHEKYL